MAGRGALSRRSAPQSPFFAFVALTLATFVAITTELVPVGLLPQISADLEVTEAVAGLLVTVYAFMVAVLAIPLTLGTRRLPRKGLLLVTLAAYTVSNALVGIAPSFALGDQIHVQLDLQFVAPAPAAG